MIHSAEDSPTVGTDALLHGEATEQAERKERDCAEYTQTAVLILQHSYLKPTRQCEMGIM